MNKKSYKCTPHRLGWHKKYFSCYCKFIWETPTYKLTLY